MKRTQKKKKRAEARRRNRVTSTRWERRFRERWIAMSILGLVGVVIAQWIVRALEIPSPEKNVAMALGWVLAALLSLFLPVRV